MHSRSVMDDFQAPRRARVTFQAKDIKSKVSVDNGKIAEAQLEPIRNPVTGKVHNVILELPQGFEGTRMNMSSTTKNFANDGYLKFEYSGRYGSFQETKWKGP